MKQENLTPLEQLIRSAAPRVQVDEAMSSRLEKSLRAASVSRHRRSVRWWHSAAAVAMLVLLAVAGVVLYEPEPPAAPCYVGRISAEAVEPILAPYEVRNGMSYGIVAGEYEVVIADVAL